MLDEAHSESILQNASQALQKQSILYNWAPTYIIYILGHIQNLYYRLLLKHQAGRRREKWNFYQKFQKGERRREREREGECQNIAANWFRNCTSAPLSTAAAQKSNFKNCIFDFDSNLYSFCICLCFKAMIKFNQDGNNCESADSYLILFIYIYIHVCILSFFYWYKLLCIKHSLRCILDITISQHIMLRTSGDQHLEIHFHEIPSPVTLCCICTCMFWIK